ncbi:MAG: 4-hydroxy-3-methylbut-2-enyl diphosphate reductase [Proteobacteria bacterium]|nr:4-hydroxy-3-methylbut-2-enyl diphosphate reductase [Pseudomonadota bacterium]
MQVLLAQPRGFCAGVERAVSTVERALELYGAPVFVFHEIVHNGRVVEDLRRRGALFVNEIEAIPPGGVVVFSAHGVSDEVVARAEARRLRIIDATCPLVGRVHSRLRRYARLGYALVMVGHSGHDEVVGTVGSVQAPVHLVASLADVWALDIPASARVAYVTQTTLSLDDTAEIIAALRARFAHLEGPDLDDICYATHNRQRAVRELARRVDLVLVVGALNSSNSARLREVAQQCGVTAYLIEDAEALNPQWLRDVTGVGVTAGASTPEALVREVCERLGRLGATAVRELHGEPEAVSFRLPPGLVPLAEDADLVA